MKLCFATNNNHKIQEVNALLGDAYELASLREMGFKGDLAEDFLTMEENAFQKADYIYRNFGISCFADDSGLEVYALDYKPGVRSARYAGDQKNDEDNIDLLLQNLSDQKERKARFRTVISLIIGGKSYFFEGIIEGRITREKRGKLGFGYDPIFIPDGFNKTFAEMTTEEKNMISHRGTAVKKLIHFLEEYNYKHLK